MFRFGLVLIFCFNHKLVMLVLIYGKFVSKAYFELNQACFKSSPTYSVTPFSYICTHIQREPLRENVLLGIWYSCTNFAQYASHNVVLAFKRCTYVMYMLKHLQYVQWMKKSFHQQLNLFTIVFLYILMCRSQVMVTIATHIKMQRLDLINLYPSCCSMNF